MYQRVGHAIPFLFVAALSISGPGSAIQAEQWAHWRGPIGNGTSLTARPPAHWSETENIKWKVAVPGRGSGSPVVWNQRIFVVSAIPVRSEGGEGQPATSSSAGRPRRGSAGTLPLLQFKLFCFDRNTGKLLWDRVAITARPHEGTHQTNGYASASPCTDGQHVYAHFGSRGLYCYTVDGELVWKRMFGHMRTRNGFGEGSSPTLAGNKILVPWDHEGPSALYALDKTTGKVIWKTDRDEPTCWATPLVVEHAGRKQVVMNGQNKARAYDLDTGKELWRCGGQTQRPVASAVAGNGLIFVGSGFRGAFLGAFRPDGRGDIEGTRFVAWTVHRDTPDIGSPLLSDNRLYFYKGKTGMLTCVDATTGEPHYQAQRLPGIRSTYASPIAAGGYVYLTGRSGRTVVIRDSNKLELVAENTVGETVDATPAPVGNQLIIRGEKHLFCIESGSQSSP